tara:strand:+ start:6735 stop:9326 length:2592 start_codon:yes stop_codon:yes gene_type:complete
MARLKYRSSRKRKPFNPLQLSTQGITEMRRDSERRIRGMRQNFEAEREQQRRDREAMKENAALEQEAINRDRQIELENLKNEQTAMSQQASVDRQQAQYDAEATKTIIDSLAGLSKTIAVTAAERTAKMKKDQTKEGENRDITELYDKTVKALDSLYVGSTAASADILENANETNEPFLKTIQAIVSEPGLGAIQERIVANRILDRLHGREISKALQSPDRLYRDAQGNDFSGVEAANDPGKMTIVTDRVRNDLIKRLGLNTAAPGYLDVSNKSIRERSDALIDRAYNGGVAQQQAIAKAKADDLRSSGLGADIAKAWEFNANVSGKADAWKNTHAILEDPTSSISEVNKAYAIIDGVDMKAYHKNPEKYSVLNPDHPRAAQIQPRLAKRLENQRKADKATRDFAKAQLYQFEYENISTITQAFRENYQQAEKAALERAHKAGVPLTPLMKSIMSSVKSELEDEERATLTSKIRFSALDETYVNSIQNPTIRKQGVEALAKQEEQKYGPAALGIKKGFKATARKLTKINPNENTGSPQTYLVQTRLEREYKKQLAITQDPIAANKAVNDMIDAAVKGDASSPFYSETGENNRLIFTNIETADTDLAQKNMMIDKRMVTYGAGVASQAGLLATADEMDAAIESAQSNGTIIYPKGVLRVAAKFGLKPSEVFNEQRKANNLVTGENKPLMTESIGTDVFDGLTPANREVHIKSQEFKSYQLGLRVQANSTGTLNNHVRGSMQRSVTGALSYKSNEQTYRDVGTVLQQLNFRVAEHPDFGGSSDVHAANSYHNYGEAFDVTHHIGDYDSSIAKTEALKNKIRELNLFAEVIGPGDGDPNHETHLHLGGLMRPITEEDIKALNSLGI